MRWLNFFSYLLCLVISGGVGLAETYTIDPTTIRAKINVLGLRDDTLDYQDRPHHWLKERRDQIIPYLVQGLDHPEKRAALGCLKILDAAENPTWKVELLRIAGDTDHPICDETALCLRRFAGEEEVAKLLEELLADPDRLTDIRDRADILAAVQRRSEAAMLLIPQLELAIDESKLCQTIDHLGKIGDSAAVDPLLELTDDFSWYTVKEAYFALARIDPDNYGLSDDQRTFLEKAGRGFKASRATYIKHAQELAQLNRREIRPLVMHMIKTDTPRPGLLILRTWKDKNALSDIRYLITEHQGRYPHEFMLAYVDIEGTEASVAEMLRVLLNSSQPDMMQGGGMPGMMPGMSDQFRYFDCQRLLNLIASSGMSVERKLQILRQIRDAVGHRYPNLVPMSLWRADEDRSLLLKSMMAEETNSQALGHYVWIAARDPEKRFKSEVTQALSTLAFQKTITDDQSPTALRILKACKVYEIAESGKLADNLLAHPNADLRLVAAQLAIRWGNDHEKALQVLYRALDTNHRETAAEYLSEIKCRNETERKVRESILLSHVGQESENEAFRVLPTCNGSQTAEALLPILDDQHTPRAVYAAWVLAQHPSGPVVEKANRRLAVCRVLCPSNPQQTSQIRETPEMSASEFRSLILYSFEAIIPQSPLVKPPEELFQSLELDEKEQAFSICLYRYLQLQNMDIPIINGSLDSHKAFLWPGSSFTLNKSFLPLLNVIATEDPHLKALHVKGHKVAYFPNRQAAARAIAATTGEEACYPGLDGKSLYSEQLPQVPYANQNRLIARYVLDLIEAADINQVPTKEQEWRIHSSYESFIRNLMSDHSGFGLDLREALRIESDRRDVSEQLEQAEFSIWKSR